MVKGGRIQGEMVYIEGHDEEREEMMHELGYLGLPGATWGILGLPGATVG